TDTSSGRFRAFSLRHVLSFRNLSFRNGFYRFRRHATGSALRHAWLLACMTAKRYLLVIFDPGSPLHFRVIAGPFDIAQPPIGFMGIGKSLIPINLRADLGE